MTCLDQVYQSVPVGSDFVLSFDVTRDCQGVELDQICNAVLSLYDATLIQSGDELLDALIATVSLADNPGYFTIFEDRLSITIPWSIIETYINSDPLMTSFKGEIYGKLAVGVYGENVGLLETSGVLATTLSITTDFAHKVAMAGEAEFQFGTNKPYMSLQTDPQYSGWHEVIYNLKITQEAVAEAETGQIYVVGSVPASQDHVLDVGICDVTFHYGPLMAVIGANRYMLPTSPYQSNHEQLPVDSFTEGTEPIIRRTLYDMLGRPINVDDMTVKYLVKEVNGEGHLFDIEAVVADGSSGEVQVFVPKELVTSPGMYLSDFQVFNKDDILLYQIPRWLEVLPNYASNYATRPLTIAELRLALKDYPEFNGLLENVEFSDQELIWALMRPIDIWNSMPPILSTMTPTQFARYRGAWLWGSMAELFSLAANYYRREHLPYSASGLSIDDKDKAEAYMQAAEINGLKFKEFVERRKAELNILGGFLFLEGPYSNVWGS